MHSWYQIRKRRGLYLWPSFCLGFFTALLRYNCCSEYLNKHYSTKIHSWLALGWAAWQDESQPCRTGTNSSIGSKNQEGSNLIQDWESPPPLLPVPLFTRSETEIGSRSGGRGLGGTSGLFRERKDASPGCGKIWTAVEFLCFLCGLVVGAAASFPLPWHEERLGQNTLSVALFLYGCDCFLSSENITCW